MRIVRPFHLVLVLAAGLCCAAVQSAAAAPIKYPVDSPVFTFEIPADWTTKDVGGASKALYCMAPEGAVQFQLYVVSNQELKDDLTGFAQSALKEGGTDDIEAVKSGEKDVNGMPAKFARMSFKTSGKSFASLFVSLPMDSDTTCVIHCFLLAENLDKYKDQMDKIINSIKKTK